MSTTYKEEIEVWVDDYGYDINAQLTDDEGNVFDLTGYTVVVRVTEPNATNSKFQSNCTITDAANGKVKFTVADGNFDVAGQTYAAVFIATKTGVEVSFGGLQIYCNWKPQPVS